jgi:peptide/nickel transport system permease protein
VIWGTRTAFEIGIIVMLATLAIGGLIGAVSAFVGGWVDELVQRVVEIFLAFPFLLAALTLSTALASRLQNGLIVGDRTGRLRLAIVCAPDPR